MENDNMWVFAILCAIFSKDDLNFPQPPEYTDEEKALDEEYAESRACERAIKDNRHTLQYGGYPNIKKVLKFVVEGIFTL